MKLNTTSSRRARAVTFLSAATCLACGCSMMVDPFTDEFANQPAVTTPSVDGVRAANVEAKVPAPRGEAAEVLVKDGTVTHGPLYFEDAYAGDGSEDGQFAWTGKDYSYMPVEWGRFLLNALFFPVSAIDTPPWEVMASDGYPSRCVLGTHYDAEHRVENH